MIEFHLRWTQIDEDGLGQLHALGLGFAWKEPSDRADDAHIDFQSAVEMTALDFPPRFAIRRPIN